MGNNVLEFFVKMKDMMSAGLVRIQDNVQRVTSEIKSMQAQAEHTGSAGHGGGLGHMLGAMGIMGAGMGGLHMMEQGLEKVHELHTAEAALQNTMMNMGTYSHKAFEEVIDSAAKMSKGVLFSKIEIIDLQSQLRLVGNIGEKEMERLTVASADMATKYHMGLAEAGNAIAKAVNNPEMLRRLAMQLKIDPAMVEHLQDLAKNGKEAEARLELLTIVEQKVGGAARAAFDADPLAKFHKTIESIEMSMGQALVPVLKMFGRIVEFFKDHAAVLKRVGIGILAYIMWTKIAAFWTTNFGSAAAFATIKTRILNGVMSLNPMGLLVAGFTMLCSSMFEYSGAQSEVISKQEILNSVSNEAKKSVVTEILNAQKLIDKLRDHHASRKEQIQALHDLHAASETYFGRLTLETAQTQKATDALKAYSDAIEQNAMIKAAENKMVKLQEEYIDNKELYDKTKGKLSSNGLGINGNALAESAWQNYKKDYDDKMGSLKGIASQNPIDIKSHKAEGGVAGSSGKDVASGITGGGPRVININGVKFAEKIEIHAATMAGGMDEMEQKLEESFLRILNSGASVQ